VTLAGGTDEGAPFADALPVAPVGRPLGAQLVMRAAYRGIGGFRQQADLPGCRENREALVGEDLLQGGGRVDQVRVDQLVGVGGSAQRAPGWVLATGKTRNHSCVETGPGEVLAAIEPIVIRVG